MAKRCEICGKGPVVGRNISHAHNVTAAAFRAESPARAGTRERGHPAASRLHPLPPVEQGRQGRLSGGSAALQMSQKVRQAVSTEAAPKAIGPYSQAIRAGELLFVSGQIPLDPATGVLVDGDIATQTHRVFANLKAILEAGGASLDRVVRTTVYLADMDDFVAMNEVYATYFSAPAPARATVQAARLPKDARIEIDVIAVTS